MVTVNGAVTVAPLVTTICTGPMVLSSGVNTLIWSAVQAGLVATLQKKYTNAGFPFTVTLTPLSCVGINPEAKDGAVLQITPAAGVDAGTRFTPLISTYVF